MLQYLKEKGFSERIFLKGYVTHSSSVGGGNAHFVGCHAPLHLKEDEECFSFLTFCNWQCVEMFSVHTQP